MVTGFQIFECRRNVPHLERRIDYWPDPEVFDHADHALEHFDGSNDDALNAQSKELTALAQKVATESAEPIKDSVAKAFKKVA